MITTGVDTIRVLLAVEWFILAAIAYCLVCISAYEIGGLVFRILYTAMFA